MSFFDELKRRNVIRVGIAYAVVAWLLLQLTEVLKELLGLPDELGRTVVLILAIGFLPVLIFAWAFEWTPEGIKRDADVDRTDSVSPQAGRKLDRLIIVVLTVALAGFAWDKFGGLRDSEQASAPGPATEQADLLDQSIAVLPFVNMSGNQDNEYFSDGLSEELLNLLAKVNGLKVAARTSSFTFKNSNADIGEIGQALNVATILEGSVRRSGNQARITAQLIKVDDGFHLWSETFDRELDNIFQVQDEIATAIVDALKLPLLGQDATPLQSESATSFEAYDLYLLGQFSAKSWTEEDLTAAIDYFKRALELDDSFAPAWAGLAKSYALVQDFGNMDRNQALQLGAEAVANALQLDPQLPEALSARALLHRYEGNTSLALETAQQALAIDPNNVEAMRQIVRATQFTVPPLALEMATRAWELDPLSGPGRRMLLMSTNWANNDLSDVEALAEDMLASNPNDPNVFEGLAETYRARDQHALAAEYYRKTWQGRPGDVYPAARLVQLYLSIGDLEQAQRWAALARERGGVSSVWADDAQDRIDIYLGKFESYLQRKQKALQAESFTQVRSRSRLGLALYQTGQQREAIEQLRLAVPLDKAGGFEVTNYSEYMAGSMLAALLPAGQQRQDLTEKLYRFAQDRQWDNSWLAFNHVLKALIYAGKNQRDEMLSRLEKALAMDWVDTQPLKQHPAMQAWQEDPLLQELLLRMEARAAQIRLEVAKAVGKAS